LQFVLDLAALLIILISLISICSSSARRGASAALALHGVCSRLSGYSRLFPALLVNFAVLLPVLLSSGFTAFREDFH
jgi:hypothetical protein